MEVIEHKGIVVSVDPAVTKVEIIRSSACGTCHAKELCGFSEESKKTVEVATDGFKPHEPGDEVVLCMKRTMGMKAVWIAYVLPLVILVAAILLMSLLHAGELATGLAAIGAVALYYLVIFLLRGKLNDDFVFYIK